MTPLMTMIFLVENPVPENSARQSATVTASSQKLRLFGDQYVRIAVQLMHQKSFHRGSILPLPAFCLRCIRGCNEVPRALELTSNTEAMSGIQISPVQSCPLHTRVTQHERSSKKRMSTENEGWKLLEVARSSVVFDWPLSTKEVIGLPSGSGVSSSLSNCIQPSTPPSSPLKYRLAKRMTNWMFLNVMRKRW